MPPHAALREGLRLAAALRAIRHAVLPAVALPLARALGLPPGQQAVAVALAALPTASSAYVRCARVGMAGTWPAW